MKKIKLSKGLEAIVDDEYYELLSSMKWYASYSGRGHKNSHYAKNNKHGYLHRYLLDVKDPKRRVIHINGDTLDNRICNLK